MAILVSSDTRIMVQGMTGRAGTFYTDQAMRYVTQIVAGVRPGKGGGRHLGLPLFDTPAEAVAQTGANASLVMVPAHRAADAIVDAISAGVGTIVCVTERVPQHDMTRIKAALEGSGSTLVGPNSQGILSPGVSCKIGVMPTIDAKPGPVGIASRSASLTSEVLAQLSGANLGQSTTVGIGGDAIHGMSFTDCLKAYREDDETEAVVLIGEIGGREEEDAAAYLASANYGKPVVALVVGRKAPRETRMGHAGTLSIFGAQTAAQKIDALQDAGVIIADNADDVVPKVQAALKA